MACRLVIEIGGSDAVDVDQIRGEGTLKLDYLLSYLDYVIDGGWRYILKSETSDWNPSILYIIR